MGAAYAKAQASSLKAGALPPQDRKGLIWHPNWAINGPLSSVPTPHPPQPSQHTAPHQNAPEHKRLTRLSALCSSCVGACLLDSNNFNTGAHSAFDSACREL